MHAVIVNLSRKEKTLRSNCIAQVCMDWIILAIPSLTGSKKANCLATRTIKVARQTNL